MKKRTIVAIDGSNLHMCLTQNDFGNNYQVDYVALEEIIKEKYGEESEIVFFSSFSKRDYENSPTSKSSKSIDTIFQKTDISVNFALTKNLKNRDDAIAQYLLNLAYKHHGEIERIVIIGGDHFYCETFEKINEADPEIQTEIFFCRKGLSHVFMKKENNNLQNFSLSIMDGYRDRLISQHARMKSLERTVFEQGQTINELKYLIAELNGKIKGQKEKKNEFKSCLVTRMLDGMAQKSKTMSS